MSLKDRRALVMGGSSGIGLETARRFADADAEVVITGRNTERLTAAAREIGGNVTAHAVDATEPGHLAEFFAADVTYDYLVLAVTGRSGAGPLAQLDLATLAAGFDGKFWPQVRTVQAALPRLRPDASITMITAGSAISALPGTAGLAAINGALEAMVPPLAVELSPRRINAVSPGVVDTPWWEGMAEEQRDEMFTGYASTAPVGRVGRPEEVADAAFFVATNGFMTGSVIACTGGVHLAAGRR